MLDGLQPVLLSNYPSIPIRIHPCPPCSVSNTSVGIMAQRRGGRNLPSPHCEILNSGFRRQADAALDKPACPAVRGPEKRDRQAGKGGCPSKSQRDEGGESKRVPELSSWVVFARVVCKSSE